MKRHHVNRVSRILVALLALAVDDCYAQLVSGAVTAADTGAGLAGANVILVQRRSSLKQQPVIYGSRTDASGHYSASVEPGTYTFCVKAPPIYLDPCIWGGIQQTTVATNSQTTIDLRLTRGWPFILRVHDSYGVLPQVESIRGGSVSVSVAGGAVGPVLLPLLYQDKVTRDYGANVPLATALTANIAADGRLQLAGTGGTALSALGIGFQAAPPAAPTFPMFRPPDATVIHVFIKGIN